MTARIHNRTWSRPQAHAVLIGGPTRVKDEEPPEDWEPKPFIGFTSRLKD